MLFLKKRRRLLLHRNLNALNPLLRPYPYVHLLCPGSPRLDSRPILGGVQICIGDTIMLPTARLHKPMVQRIPPVSHRGPPVPLLHRPTNKNQLLIAPRPVLLLRASPAGEDTLEHQQILSAALALEMEEVLLVAILLVEALLLGWAERTPRLLDLWHLVSKRLSR